MPSAKGSSHKPAFMGGCLIISHTCWLCLSSGRVSACVPGIYWRRCCKCGLWVGCQCMEFVIADWCYREVVKPRSDCKKTYLWWCWLLRLNLRVRGKCESALKFWYCEPSVKNNVGRDKRPNVGILDCFICWWEGVEVEKVEGWWGDKVWNMGEQKGGKVEKVGEWWGEKGGRFLVLFKSGGRRMSSRFHLFVYNINQGNERKRWVQDFITWPHWWKDFP